MLSLYIAAAIAAGLLVLVYNSVVIIQDVLVGQGGDVVGATLAKMLLPNAKTTEVGAVL